MRLEFSEVLAPPLQEKRILRDILNQAVKLLREQLEPKVFEDTELKMDELEVVVDLERVESGRGSVRDEAKAVAERLLRQVEHHLPSVAADGSVIFPLPLDMDQSMRVLKDDLQEVPVKPGAHGAKNVYEKLLGDAELPLSSEQRQRILRVLAEVRDFYYRIEERIGDGYQVVNWKHTRGEIDQVMEACKLNGLSARDTEDAVLASIFSDSVKSPKNFITHNVDGAKAADAVLRRYFGGDPDRVEGIMQAILEHQIGPPKFMAMIASGMIGGALGKEKTPAQEAALATLKAKMEDPLANRTQDGRELSLTPAEKDLLGLIGIENWWTPHEGSPWYNASRAVIDGDSLINYASPDGWAKIVAIRGPDTGPFFKDPTVFGSMDSAKQSYDDAYVLLSPGAKELAREGLQRTHSAIARVRSAMESWFDHQEVPRNPDGTIAFWNSDLSYEENRNDLEEAQFQFAKQIREQTVELLRAEQGAW